MLPSFLASAPFCRICVRNSVACNSINSLYAIVTLKYVCLQVAHGLSVEYMVRHVFHMSVQQPHMYL